MQKTTITMVLHFLKVKFTIKDGLQIDFQNIEITVKIFLFKVYE